MQTLELRKGWNRPAPSEFALPTETWREVVARRKRYDEVRAKLAAGEVRDINDLITLNLDIRQFAAGRHRELRRPGAAPRLLARHRAVSPCSTRPAARAPSCSPRSTSSSRSTKPASTAWRPSSRTCERSGEKHRPEKFADFRKILAHVAAHPNRRYFILKSIILNNLFGVDIMEEAVEICKLRLFLKLVAQVEPDIEAGNLGIEPLPDIDFNIRAGNTLVGYATYDEVKAAVRGKLDLDNAVDQIEVKAADLQQAFDAFRQRQIEGDGSVPTDHKQELRRRLKALEDELNRHVARVPLPLVPPRSCVT